MLPGFPTSAMFTFHDFVVPLVRALAGLPPRRGRTSTGDRYRSACRPSSAGRNSSWPPWPSRRAACVALPLAKGSGSVTAFSQADGFFAVPAERSGLEAGEPCRSRGSGRRCGRRSHHHRQPLRRARPRGRAARGARAPRTARSGSARPGGSPRWQRGECDLAALHLLDTGRGPTTRRSSARAGAGAGLAPAAGRRVPPRRSPLRRALPRRGDRRCPAEPETRDGQPQHRLRHPHPRRPAARRRRPPGFWNQPRSHNAVAAAVAQGRADWGVAIATVAQAYGLGFLPLAEEHCYDFALVTARRDRPAVRAFLAALASPAARAALKEAGFRPGLTLSRRSAAPGPRRRRDPSTVLALKNGSTGTIGQAPWPACSARSSGRSCAVPRRPARLAKGVAQATCHRPIGGCVCDA